MKNTGLIGALIVSLAINLFALGAVAGGVWVAHKAKAEMTPAPVTKGGNTPLWRAADSLLPADRDAFISTLRGQARRVAPQIRQAKVARREAWAMLTAPTVDVQAINAKLTAARALEATSRGEVEAGIVSFAATLSPADRAQLSDALAHSSSGGGIGIGRLPRTQKPATP